MADLTLHYGLACFIAPGHRDCGDLAVVRRFDGGALVAAIDGIGHGDEAAAAARLASEIIARSPAESLVTLVTRCHESLRYTRGVVLSIARLDLRRGSLTWLGVGNVIALVQHPGVPPERAELLLRAGVLGGASLPNLQPSDMSLRELDMLILATDGIRPQFADGVALSGSPQSVADEILARHRHGGDDALVVVARLS